MSWTLLTTTESARKLPKFYKARPQFFVEDCEIDENEVMQDIAKAQELDTIDIFGHSDEDFDALKKYMDETTQSFVRKEGRVFVKLPKFHGISQPLSKNTAMVQAQIQKLQAKFMEDPSLEEAYVKAITEWIQMGVLVPVTEKELDSVKYWAEMPYHPVFRQAAKTHKVRIVMNGSAKSKGTASLNDYLATGPNILPQIVNILSKFRTSNYFVIADIEKAFLQVGLLEPDDHLFVFRWLEKDENGIPRQKLYRFARMPWGINSAPFVLNAVVRFLYDQAAKDAIKQGNKPKALRLESLRDTTYVDDVLALGNSIQETVLKAKAAKEALEAGKMKVTKFRSFPPYLVKQVDPQAKPEKEPYKILGINYDPETDTIAPAADKIASFKDVKSLTKKQAAGIGARLYDPAGLLVPKALQAKLLMQQLERDHPKTSWSVKLTEPQSDKWHEFVKDVEQNLPSIRFPRKTRPEKWDKLRLCIFTDASASAIAATMYEVAEVKGQMYPVLVGSRNKVIPLKKRFTAQGVDSLTKDSLKINRLELTAAALGAKMAQQHLAATETTYDEVLGFTDSQVTCHWLWSQTEHHTEYVRSRVQVIKTVIPPQNWRHVPGEQNPADIASRGATLKELIDNKLWHKGPEWMSQARTDWPQVPKDFMDKMSEVCSLMCCTRQMTKKAKQAQEKPNVPAETGKKDNSTWNSLIKEIRDKEPQKSPEQASNDLIRQIQKQQMPNLYESLKSGTHEKKLSDNERNLRHQYGLFFDKDSELVYSRSRNATPRSGNEEEKGRTAIDRDLIFVPATGDIVRKLVQKIHQEDTGHGSANHVATESRQRYWILHVRKIAKNVRRHCPTCKLLDAKPLTQIEGPLPAKRYKAMSAAERKPFYTCGIDFVGPFFPFKNKDKTKSQSDLYDPKKPMHIAVFSCAMTRAVHLEVMSDLSFEQFELAFTNFSARRGIPNTVYSDNAKTFIVAKRLVQMNEEMAAKVIEAYKSKLTWVFNASRAPWWGGFFERMMRIIKDKLARNFYRQTFPSPDHFRSAVTLLEKFVNNRPLTTFYSDRQECTPITPSQFLQPGEDEQEFTLLQFSDNKVSTQAMTVKQLRQRRINQANFQKRLWYDFQCMYLDELRQYHRRAGKKDEADKLKPGTYVLVTPDDTSFKPGAMLHKMMWRRARVVSLQRGRDTRFRKVKIEWPNNKGTWMQAEYPIQKLCPLELTDEEKSEFFTK